MCEFEWTIVDSQQRVKFFRCLLFILHQGRFHGLQIDTPIFLINLSISSQEQKNELQVLKRMRTECCFVVSWLNRPIFETVHDMLPWILRLRFDAVECTRRQMVINRSKGFRYLTDVYLSNVNFIKFCLYKCTFSLWAQRLANMFKPYMPFLYGRRVLKLK